MFLGLRESCSCKSHWQSTSVDLRGAGAAEECSARPPPRRYMTSMVQKTSLRSVRTEIVIDSESSETCQNNRLSIEIGFFCCYKESKVDLQASDEVLCIYETALHLTSTS